MDMDKFGILLTIAIVGTVLSFGGITSGEYGFDNMGLEIPVEKKITQTTNTGSSNAYYEWCYKMGLEC